MARSPNATGTAGCTGASLFRPPRPTSRSDEACCRSRPSRLVRPSQIPARARASNLGGKRTCRVRMLTTCVCVCVCVCVSTVRHPGQMRRAAALALPGSRSPANSPLAPVHRRGTHTLHLFPGSKPVTHDGCGRTARRNGRRCQLAASGLEARGAAWGFIQFNYIIDYIIVPRGPRITSGDARSQGR